LWRRSSFNQFRISETGNNSRDRFRLSIWIIECT
jgi:hypothetical protein